MNLYSVLRNSTTDRCFWQIFVTKLHQTWPQLIPAHPLLQTPLPNFDLAEINEIKITPNKPRESDVRLHNLYSMSPSSPAQSKCASTVQPLLLSVSVQYTVQQTTHSAKNCLQSFPPLVYCIFSLQASSVVPSTLSVYYQYSRIAPS